MISSCAQRGVTDRGRQDPGLCRGVNVREVPNIVGMKDEHGDMKRFVRQWRAASDRLELLCGVGEILAPSYFALGVKGFTSGIVNFMPRTPLRIMELLRAGQLKAAAEVVEREAMLVFDLRSKRPGYTTVVIKDAITLCGLEVGPPRPPLAPLAEPTARNCAGFFGN